PARPPGRPGYHGVTMNLPGPKLMLSSAGALCVALGVLGIFLPLLPTTPFLLLAAWLFMRSSPRMHQWLVQHRRLGPFIRAWEGGAGLERRLRTRVFCILAIGMALSMVIVGTI